MRMSEKGLARLICFEGLAVKAYRDVKGIWTIGVGHTAAAGWPRPRAGMELSVEAAINLLRHDIRKYELGVERFLGGKSVPQHVFDTMVSFHYNTGAIARASWAKAARDGDIARAAKLIMNWKRPAAVISRRKQERAMLRGDYGSNFTAVLWTADNRGKLRRKGAFDALEAVRGMRRVEDTHVEKTLPDEGQKAARRVGIAGAIAAALAGLVGAVLAAWDEVVSWIGQILGFTQ